MRRNYPNNPLLQPVKGVFVFDREADDYHQKGLELLKTMHCQVLSTMDNRITISTSRGNLQNIKQCWLSNDEDNTLSQELNRCVRQIIIGGRV